jgi:hypothetical protein
VTALIRQLRLLLLGVWIGAALFFGAGVAPALFGVLRGAGLANANDLAGAVVSRLLALINTGGFEIGLFLLITGFFINHHRSRVAQVAEMISLAILAMMTGINHWVISTRLLDLRRSMGGVIDQVALSDPRRIAFDSLHRYSVALMGVALIAALVAFVLASRREQPKLNA